MIVQHALLIACLLTQAPTIDKGEPPDASEIYEQTVDSVLWTIASGRDKELSGTAVLVDAGRGFALTAAHCVGGKDHAAYTMTAYAPDRDRDGRIYNTPQHYRNSQNLAIPARVVAIDPALDLALLRLRAVPPRARAVPLALLPAKPGSEVLALGNSGSARVLWRFADGKCRAVYPDRYRFDDGQEVEASVLETSLPSNPGDSGGPMLSRHGELVGITSAISPKETLIQKGIYYAEIWSFLQATGLDMNVTLHGYSVADAAARTRRVTYVIALIPGDKSMKKRFIQTHVYYVTTAADGRVTVSPLVAVADGPGGGAKGEAGRRSETAK